MDSTLQHYAKLTYFLQKLFNSEKSASEYRGYYTALIIILIEYIGILYISYSIYKYIDGLDGVALGWLFWYIWYRYISPIPFLLSDIFLNTLCINQKIFIVYLLKNFVLLILLLVFIDN